MRADPSTLELKPKLSFFPPELLRRALIHSSLANDVRTANGTPLSDNEQMEFLGDSILGFLVSEALVQRGPEARKASCPAANPTWLALPTSRRSPPLDLGSFWNWGAGKKSAAGAPKEPSGGCLGSCSRRHLPGWRNRSRRDFVVSHVMDAPFEGDVEAGTDIQPAITNFKSALQEYARANKLPPPRYTVTASRARALQDLHCGSPHR